MMKKSMLKKTLFSLLLMIFFFTAILPMAGFDTAAFAVGPGQPDIDVMLKEYVELKAGETGNLVLTFKNNSTTTSARSLYFIPDYQNDKDRIFTEIKPVTEMPVKYLTSYDGKADIEISVTVDKFAQEGFHTLPFKLKYSYSVDDYFALRGWDSTVSSTGKSTRPRWTAFKAAWPCGARWGGRWPVGQVHVNP